MVSGGRERKEKSSKGEGRMEHRWKKWLETSETVEAVEQLQQILMLCLTFVGFWFT